MTCGNRHLTVAAVTVILIGVMAAFHSSAPRVSPPKQQNETLPAGSVLFQSRDGIDLYTYHDASATWENPLQTNNYAYILDQERVLAKFALLYSEQLNIVAVYKDRIALLRYGGDWRAPNIAYNVLPLQNVGAFYFVNREQGTVSAYPEGDATSAREAYWATGPDESFLVFGSVGAAPSVMENGQFIPSSGIRLLDLDNYWHSYLYRFEMGSITPYDPKKNGTYIPDYP